MPQATPYRPSPWATTVLRKKFTAPVAELTWASPVLVFTPTKWCNCGASSVQISKTRQDVKLILGDAGKSAIAFLAFKLCVGDVQGPPSQK